MNSNNLNDISKLYLEQVSESHVPGKPAEKLGAVTAIPKDEQDAARERVLAKAKAMREKKGIEEEKKEKAKRWWDDDGDGIGYEKGEVSGKFKRKKVKEAKEVKRWWDDDGDGIGYEKGEVSGKFKRKKKETVKEGYSNWREDLSEVMGAVEKSNKNKKSDRIEDKQVDNKSIIKICPSIGEAIENLGGTLLEMEEIDEIEDQFECILEDLHASELYFLSDRIIEEVVDQFFTESLEEGYDADHILECLLESIDNSILVLNEATVTTGHDTKTEKKKGILGRLKKFAKKAYKKLVRGAGYTRGLASRVYHGTKKEYEKGYQRGKHGSGEDSEEGSDDRESRPSPRPKVTSSDRPDRSSSTRSRVTSSASDSLMSGLRKTRKPKTYRYKGSDLPSKQRYQVAGSAPSSRTQDKKTSSTNVRAGQPGKERKSLPPSSEKSKKKKSVSKTTKITTSSTPTPTPNPPKPKNTTSKKGKKKEDKLDALLKSIRSEQVQIDEKTLTAAETKKREKIVKSMKDKSADFEKRYPGRGKEVMYATATKMAKKIAEQAMEIQPKTPEKSQHNNQEIAASKKAKSAAVSLKTKELQTLRQTPAGTQVPGFG